ncbi:hypothetical protein EHO61_02630 [Leptospira fluminis]|uniref:Nitroreductase n=1 Tax=Leptospira fluminis TaxID=2484979 RepID=A0A4R9GS09_9LEPT|nr:hypothetical protein [Leptospira fluminis]TGK20783.1 hypothetical protein EHO61_02630 [Leptospira fluminis]
MESFSRKSFLKRAIGVGAVLTVSEFLEACSTVTDRNFGPKGNDPYANSESMKYDRPIFKALNVGITAPNPHNVQPWKFEILDDHSANLYVDENRLLLDTDPPTRQVHIGQGTFLETLAIGSTRLGYKAEIEMFPKGKYETKDIGKKPVAKIRLLPDAGISADPLAEFIPLRATVRGEYHGSVLNETEFSTLLKDAKPNFSRAVMMGISDFPKVKKAVYSAMEVETNTYQTYEESRIWFRYNDEEINRERDGLSLRGSGVSGLKYFFVRNFFLSPGKESWHSEGNRSAGLGMFADQVESSKGFVYLVTKQNRFLDWVLAGRDYARLQLAATKNGYVVHPLSQILQEYHQMDSLRKEFETIAGLKPGEKVQMLVRIGKSDYKFFSPRRELEKMILPAGKKTI